MSTVFEDKIIKIKNENNYRSLDIVSGIDFSSNDYLGLSNHPKIKESVINSIKQGSPIGSGGSRLLSGNRKEHIELEEFATDYFKSEACLFFNSGFLANYAIFTSLPDRKDFIIYDELIHASVREGVNSSNSKSIKFKHNDLISLKKAIDKAQNLKAQNIWVSIESIYSMDGDIADIQNILTIISNYNNVYLIVDEAHSTGLFGLEAKGLTHGLNSTKLIVLHTCSKALGVSGAIICAPYNIIEYLINKSRPFIYTTAESPLIAVAVKQALKIAHEEEWRREKLFKLIKFTSDNYLNLNHKTQIIPIQMDDSEQAIKVAAFLQAKGFNIRAIRPPTVATARLRLSLNSNRTEEEIDAVFLNILSVRNN